MATPLIQHPKTKVCLKTDHTNSNLKTVIENNNNVKGSKKKIFTSTLNIPATLSGNALGAVFSWGTTVKEAS